MRRIQRHVRSRLRLALPASALLVLAQFALITTPAAAHEPGRMTGGVSVFTANGMRVTHGFELHCVDDDGQGVIEPNNLEVNWGPGNRFHLTQLESAVCTDQPNIDEGNPEAGFDTMQGSGTGRCNGVSGATIVWRFNDEGEPGNRDVARIDIQCQQGLTLSVRGRLRYGNHQAHPA